MKQLKKLAAALLVCALAVCMLTACGGGSTPAAPEVPTDPQVAAVIEGINAARKANGKNELAYASELDATAQHMLETNQKYADEIAAGNYASINKEWNTYYSELQKSFTIQGKKAEHKGGTATVAYTTDFMNNASVYNKEATHVGVAIGEVNGELRMTIHFAVVK